MMSTVVPQVVLYRSRSSCIFMTDYFCHITGVGNIPLSCSGWKERIAFARRSDMGSFSPAFSRLEFRGKIVGCTST